MESNNEKILQNYKTERFNLFNNLTHNQTIEIDDKLTEVEKTIVKKLEAKYQARKSWLRNKNKPQAESCINSTDDRLSKSHDSSDDPEKPKEHTTKSKTRRFIKRKVWKKIQNKLKAEPISAVYITVTLLLHLPIQIL